MRPAIVLLAVILAGCGARAPQLAEPTRACPGPAPAGEVALRGGTFLLGAKPEHDDEGPPRRVTVAPFSIDRTEVTNAQFAAFVIATGYVTLAERRPDPALYPGVPAGKLKPSSLVFVGAAGLGSGDPALWWRVIDGADWRHPEGPGSGIAGRERHPVVQIGYEDALAYARWKGRDLPTEAEWEFAARAGLDGARYEWGDEKPGPGQPRANSWQGVFPAVDTGDDGYKARTAPVGCYPASAFGLFDMTGNVWEWTRDWYGAPGDPGRSHLIKGGSFLCADNFCYRYRPSARQPGPPDTGTSHVGFRTVKRGGGR
ncbi:MAG: formylglycine-generating enzyme family protein [Caulobacter sp.]|nr:formylglycine-generating enzyme family protein [Caulobacter sp.]